jgi:hypothetical protein
MLTETDSDEDRRITRSLTGRLRRYGAAGVGSELTREALEAEPTVYAAKERRRSGSRPMRGERSSSSPTCSGS